MKVFYGCTKENAEGINFDHQFLFDELKVELGKRKIELLNTIRGEAKVVFNI